MATPSWLGRPTWLEGTATEAVLERFAVDFDPGPDQPSWVRLAVATVVSLVVSLAADAVLVAVGTRVLPSTKGYPHFHVSSYTKLTVIGVVVACAAWPVVTRVSSRPRWLFFRLAVLVTLVAFLPDVWLLLRGDPVRAVLVLACMHLAVALVTYNALVHLAGVGPDRARGRFRRVR